MNSVALIGRLTRDPEVRWTQDQLAIATFSIAIDRPARKDGTKETDFPRITVFGRAAENCEKYLKKGRLVGITGRIQTGSYEKDGQKFYTTDIVADRVEFLEWGENSAQTRTEAPQHASYGQQMSYSSGYGQSGMNVQPTPAPQPQPYQQQDTEQARQIINDVLGINAHFEDIKDDDIPF